MSVSFEGNQKGVYLKQMGQIMEKHRGRRTGHVRRTINAEYYQRGMVGSKTGKVGQSPKPAGIPTTSKKFRLYR